MGMEMDVGTESHYIAETGEIMCFESAMPYVETMRMPQPPDEPEVIFDEEGLPRINAQPVLWVRLDSPAGQMVKRLTRGIEAADLTTRERLEASFGHLSVGDRAALHILLQLASEYVLVEDWPKAAEALDRALGELGLVPL